MRPNPQFPVDLVTFIEEILNGKFHIFGQRYNYFTWTKTFFNISQKWEYLLTFDFHISHNLRISTRLPTVLHVYRMLLVNPIAV